MADGSIHTTSSMGRLQALSWDQPSGRGSRRAGRQQRLLDLSTPCEGPSVCASWRLYVHAGHQSAGRAGRSFLRRRPLPDAALSADTVRAPQGRRIACHGPGTRRESSGGRGLARSRVPAASSYGNGPVRSCPHAPGNVPRLRALLLDVAGQAPFIVRATPARERSRAPNGARAGGVCVEIAQ